MQYVDEPDCKKWRKRFAFFPTRIGKTADGKDVKVWLEFYEYRYPEMFTVQYRAIGSTKHYSFACTE